ncbi:DUF1178 family protein [Pseudooceanicola nanhaiensis]|jgi:hypothetical protein|uniref:DUF1178 family protein n=1 Tax=Pseudooceanicola nanhaiensis TaxID=375761 RepID=A0A917SUR0_9RHOB|nr:DUF1178 family protein [Pseudooceanicola nanhaiensis]GGL98539.1 hypothetical protein GCM10011534_20650 [Pseudooceanicola nanhaiensis]
MIQFSLKCPNDHRFDSWFQSAEAYDKLAAARMVSCAVCGADGVQKAPMAPRVAASRETEARPLSQPRTAAEQAVAELRRRIEKGSEDVGRNFVREARAIHEGEAPDRPIRGEARIDEARKLLEDGVPVMPLPFMNPRKSN